MALCRFIYGVIKNNLCNERLVHVHYVAIDDLVITTPLEKKKNDIAALWSCSGKTQCISVRARCRRFAAEPLHS